MKHGLAALALALALPAQAQPVPRFLPSDVQGPMINLTASETAEVAPDIAYMTVGVTTRNRDKALAMQENRTKIAAVLAALKAKGIADKDIETQSLNINFEYDYTAGSPRSLKGFVVSNSLRVTVRKIDMASDLVAATSSAGATNISSIDFDLEDKTPVIDRLTQAATEKAKARANFHARLNGFAATRLISVSVDDASRGGYGEGVAYANMAPAAADAAADIRPQINPARVSVTVVLAVTYEMTR